MASEVIKLNLIPKGEMPVFHASQFDTGRLITCELYRGEDAYSVPEGYTVELHCRKVDNNIVTMASTLINDNVVTFTSTEQLTACNGNNLCEVAILDEGYRIGTLNFILEVEVDPLKGGITSTSEIHNLETQVEEIVYEAVSENFYDKTEVDYLLSSKADADSVYTIGEVNTLLSGKANADDVYTKSQTDTLLSAKANSSDVYTKGQVDTALSAKADASSVYTKSQVDSALALKANAADVYTKSQVDSALALKANAADVYTKSQVDSALALKANAADVYTKEQTYTQAEVNALIDNIFPTLTASGAIATFTTALSKPLVSVTADVSATTVTACGLNLAELSEDTKNDSQYCSYVYENNGVNISASGNYARVSYVFPVKVGQTYTISFYGSGTGNFINVYYTDTTSWGSSYGRSYLTSTRTKYTMTITATSNVLFVGFYVTTDNNMGDMVIEDFMLEVGSSASDDYYAYSGQTVPVSDATTLVTQSGVNNVYADAGDITVQYKFMSM